MLDSQSQQKILNVFQGYILDDSGSQKKRRVTVGCCRRRKSSCWTGTEKEKSSKEPESFVDISCSDFRPYYKEYDQVFYRFEERRYNKFGL